MAMDSTKQPKLDLHSLPLETLQQIAGHLYESHRPSFYAFGMASAACRSVTIPSLFHQINLTVRSPEAFQRDIDTLVKSLSRTESARHVRCLSIKGSLHLDAEGLDELGDRTETSDELAWYKSTGVDEILPNEEFISSGFHVCQDEPIIERYSDEDVAWAPLINLIKTLPGLTKLVYNCRNQLPPSLLDVLHKHHPQCKLYHLTFRLRSLLQDKPHPYEMAMATSPCLYSVKVRCALRDSNGEDDFNHEAIMELAAGLAPNLKKVVVVGLRPLLADRSRRPRGPWRGLPGFVSGGVVGSLTSLSLIGAVDLCWSLEAIQAWARHTEFSSLRQLTLGEGEGCEDGVSDMVMEWIAQNSSFSRLKTLCIRLCRDDLEVERPDYANNAVALFKGFEPLSELSVSGPLERKILDAILYQHGRTLKKLSLRPSERAFNLSDDPVPRFIPMIFTQKHILQIQAECPALQELAIPVKRRNSALEAEIYRSFGKMEHLQSLFLTLDCSDWSVTRDSTYVPPASFNEYDLEIFSLDFLRKGHLREAFMNCAVDEALARSIWATICQEKVGKKLMSLRLWTTGGGQFGTSHTNADIPNVVNHLSRSWLIERVARDNKEDIINVSELGRRAREGRDQELTDWYNTGGISRRQREARARDLTTQYDFRAEYEKVAEKSECVQIFRHIWPRKEGTKDWREDWSSLPLQV